MRIPQPRTALTSLPFIAALALVALPCLAADAASSGQTTAEEVEQQLADAGEAIAEYSAQQRDEAVAAAESSLERLDERIAEAQDWVDQEWSEMTEAAQENARETMNALREQRNQVAEWLGGLKHSSEDAWDDVKDGFVDAYTELQESWQRAQKDLSDS